MQKTGQVTLETTAGQHASMGVFVFVVFLEYVCFATSGRIESETHIFLQLKIYYYIDVHMCICACTNVRVCTYISMTI